jgi:hypothetical protein
MRTAITRFAPVAVGLLFACFFPQTTRAQAETHPEEYKGDNMTSVSPASAKVEFTGHFSLPYDVQCHGHKLAPGKYTVLVKTVGQDKMVTLQREGSDVVLQSRPVPPTSVPDEGHSAVLLRHGPGPGGHTLEGVYVEDLKLVLFLDDAGHTKPLDKMFASVQRVPIT